MRKTNTLSCPRGQHRLAWVEVGDDGRRTVVAVVAIPGRDAMKTRRQRLSEADFAGFEVLSSTVTCKCGGRWSADLAAVLKGEPQTLVRDTSSFPGVSFDQ